MGKQTGARQFGLGIIDMDNINQHSNSFTWVCGPQWCYPARYLSVGSPFLGSWLTLLPAHHTISGTSINSLTVFPGRCDVRIVKPQCLRITPLSHMVVSEGAAPVFPRRNMRGKTHEVSWKEPGRGAYNFILSLPNPFTTFSLQFQRPPLQATHAEQIDPPLIWDPAMQG